MPRRSLLAFCLLSSACTSLGPIPGATGASVMPRPSPGFELQTGIVPGYYLSQATSSDDSEGAALVQTSAFLEPGKLIGLEGLALGARAVGGDDDRGHLEPMLRYRHGLTDYFAVGVVGFGTHAQGSHENASYSMTRGGLEAGVDLRAIPKNHFLEIHLLGGGSLTGLSATGRYCQSNDGYGTDCGENPANAKAHVAGAYPSAFAGIALDVANHLGPLHGLRAQGLVAAGTMPSVRFGEQGSAKSWTSLGLTLSLALGAWETSRGE